MPHRVEITTGELRMLGIGQKFPPFHLKGVVSNDLKTAFKDITLDAYKGK